MLISVYIKLTKFRVKLIEKVINVVKYSTSSVHLRYYCNEDLKQYNLIETRRGFKPNEPHTLTERLA